MVPAQATAKTPRKGPFASAGAKVKNRPTIPKGSGSGSGSTAPISKIQKPKFSSSSTTKPKRNGSILNYFKKAADEDLFMEAGACASAGDLTTDPDPTEGDEDFYGSGDDGMDETRFNEAGNSVKKRKLEMDGSANGHNYDPGPNDANDGDDKENGTAGVNKLGGEERKTPKPIAARKVGANPFLDDSEDDSEDGSNGDQVEHETVRTKPDLLASSMGCHPVLTRDAPLSRDRVPLLRRETSGDARNEALPAFGEQDSEVQDGVGLKGEEGFDGFEGGLADEDMELLGEGQWGEEFREMKYMREQARLEAEEAGFADVDDESGLAEECCPICNGSLAGATEDQATTHVNACLDGTPTPLPEPPDKSKTKGADATEMGKRFAKAAVPRPGQANPFQLGGDAEGQSKSAFAKLMNGHAEHAAWTAAAAAENASRGMPAYKRTCPFYKIMPGFSICVDAFRYGAVEGCNAYFLSHFHSDHYVGLTANWTHGPIYCSKVTASLVKSQLRTAEKFVVELEFDKKVPVPGTEGVSVTMIPANHCPGSSLFLFEKLVCGKRIHRILHCGDFRACLAHVSHPELRPETVHSIPGKTSQQKIDVCYLDTTYLNPRYSFPPQDEVIRACAELCVALNKGIAEDDDSTWNALLRRRDGGAPAGLDSVSKFFKAEKATSSEPTTSSGPLGPNIDGAPNAFTALRDGAPNRKRLLVVCGTYSIGKERICKAIAQALGTKIFASPQKIRICHKLDDPELAALMTSDPREAQVHMQMLMEIRADTLAEYLELHSRHFSRIIGFRPSGWNFRPPGTSGNANLLPSSVPSAQLLHGRGWRTRFRVKDLVPQRGSRKEAMCFGVPYSEHSSFRELAMFLMALRIEKVVPTVNVGSEQSRKRMKAWTDRWLAERRRGGLVRLLEEDDEDDGKAGRDVALWDGKSAKGGHAYW